MSNNEEDYGEVLEIDSAGVPVIEMSMDESADTSKIIVSEQSVATRVDDAFLAGQREGVLYGQFKILDLVYQILMRAHMTEPDAKDLVRIIAKHAGILENFELRRNNYPTDT